jgi:hypothetical protein
MVVMYFCYLLFQLGTHKDEFDDTNEQSAAKHPAKRNLWCQRHIFRRRGIPVFHLVVVEEPVAPPPRRLDKAHQSNSNIGINGIISEGSVSSNSSISDTELENEQLPNESSLPMAKLATNSRNRRSSRRKRQNEGGLHSSFNSSSSADEFGLNTPAHGMCLSFRAWCRLRDDGCGCADCLESCLHRAQF